MNLPPEAIKEFKEIYKKEFGEDLSDDVAYDKALDVLQVFSLLFHPNDVGTSSFDKNSSNGMVNKT